ncbi:MAG TPA: NERD domain-containing protein [Candidatus Sulfotelmatobacter sp.]|nr:NERD domain-containing protein [Candidatus Sulfotelmatobacter sp.]
MFLHNPCHPCNPWPINCPIPVIFSSIPNITIRFYVAGNEYSATEVVVLAQLLTTTRRTGDQARRAAGTAMLAAAGVTASVAAVVYQSGIGRLVGAAAATALLVLALVKLLEAGIYRQRERSEERLIRGLAARLPQAWYVLGDLVVEPSWLEPVRIWAAVVGPGGVAVVQPCLETGELTPYGHVWTVTRGQNVRSIPSPAAQAWTAAEALREMLGTDEIPIVPVVALTDLNSVFHRAESGAFVVGEPHLADGLQRSLAAGRRIWDTLQLAAYLSRYHH